MTDILMLLGLGIFIVALLFFIIKGSRRKVDMLSKPAINSRLFYTAKAAAVAACGFIPANALFPQIKWFQPPDFLNLLAVSFCISGGGIAALAMKRLGDDLVAGLPPGGIHELQTTGIYRISRNPLYLGVSLIILSSWLYAPHPVNFLLGVTAIFIHHRIVLQEEKYLTQHCGEPFRDYMERVNRYI